MMPQCWPSTWRSFLNELAFEQGLKLPRRQQILLQHFSVRTSWTRFYFLILYKSTSRPRWQLLRIFFSGLLCFCSLAIQILKQLQSLFRIHSSHRRIAISGEHYPATLGQDKFAGLNMISLFLPPGTDRISVVMSHTPGHGEAKIGSYCSGFLLGINRSGNDSYPLLSERITALFITGQ